MYVTDPTCSRVGTQCWVYGAIMVTEALLCIRHGAALFERTQALNILLWLLCQSLVSVLCVYGCVLWHQYFEVDTNAFRFNSSLDFQEYNFIFPKKYLYNIFTIKEKIEDNNCIII